MVKFISTFTLNFETVQTIDIELYKGITNVKAEESTF